MSDSAGQRNLPLSTLTNSEHETLRCILEGVSAVDIASKFSCSLKDVAALKDEALRKLGFETQIELFQHKAQILRAPGT
ncbi:LuxR C-terminal-related transcriptional regulator [Actinoplanes sp. NPDC051494]|uniref:LuxR C-terminal-related transcriptional regulator n=1 Tax=Actinoplanes sp. NPDC051494 TaxID=3363907 RepID=UPI0037BA5FFA